MMNISVVMTTYNGARKLLGQLISLRDQTRKADEVLIFDDCSDDQTVEIIQNFIYENHLYEWTLIQNERNKGKRKNYADALNTARGALLFLCEQDGEWNLDRIEKMAEIMEEREEIMVLASSYNVRFENKTGQLRHRKPKPYGEERLVQVKPDGKTFEPLFPGFTYVLRKEMVPLFRKVWEPSDAYDRVIWQSALLMNGLYVLNEKNLVQVRYKTVPDAEHADLSRTEVISYRRKLAERMRERLEITENAEWLSGYIDTAKQREDALSNRDLKQLYALSKSGLYMPCGYAWMEDVLDALRGGFKKSAL